MKELPRLSRFTLGVRVDNLFTEIIRLLILAGYANRDRKAQIIEQAIHETDVLKYFLQMIWEMKLLDDAQYLSVAQPVDDVGKQLGGWRRQLLARSS